VTKEDSIVWRMSASQIGQCLVTYDGLSRSDSDCDKDSFTGIGSMFKYSSELLEQKQVSQEISVLMVIRKISDPAGDDPVISSNTELRISATSCCILKLKEGKVSLKFICKALRKLDGSIDEFDWFNEERFETMDRARGETESLYEDHWDNSDGNVDNACKIAFA